MVGYKVLRHLNMMKLCLPCNGPCYLSALEEVCLHVWFLQLVDFQPHTVYIFLMCTVGMHVDQNRKCRKVYHMKYCEADLHIDQTYLSPYNGIEIYLSHNLWKLVDTDCIIYCPICCECFIWMYHFVQQTSWILPESSSKSIYKIWFYRHQVEVIVSHLQ